MTKPKVQSPWHQGLQVIAKAADRPMLMLIHVFDGYAYATDSYRAFRVPSVEGWGVYELDGSPCVTPGIDNFGSKVAASYAKAETETTLTVSPVADGNQFLHRTPKAVADELAAWAYYDGTRRKPSSFVEVAVKENLLTMTFGLQVEVSERTWALAATRPAAACPIDPPAADQFIGRYNAASLHDSWAGSVILKWAGSMKPLLIDHDDRTQALIMPIRT